MKRIIIIITITLASLISASAQENTSLRVLPSGSNVVDVTIGFGRYSDIVVPPISISYERILLDYDKRFSFGVGGYAGMLTQRIYTETSLGGSIEVAALLHLALTEKTEIYLGPSLGYINVSSGPFSYGTTTYGAILGVRYFFSERTGVNFHLGGLGYANLGVSFKL